MKKLGNIIDRGIYPASWILNIFVLIAVFGSMNTYMIEVYFNSDALFLPSFYKDIFVDGTGFKGWNLNGAPNFFPDILLYSVINAIIPNFKAANLVFSSTQYMLILSGFNLLLKAIIPNINKWILVFINVLFPTYLLVAIVDRDFYFAYQVISMAYHAGSVITITYSAVFFFNYIKKTSVWSMAGLLIMTFLGAFNDRIFIATFSIPVLIIFVLNIWMKDKPTQKASIAVLLSTIVAFALFVILKNNNPYYKIIGLGDRFLNFEKIIFAWDIFSKQHWSLIKNMDYRAIILLILSIGLITSIVLSIRYLIKIHTWKNCSANTKFEMLFIFFGAGVLFFNVFSPVINGNYIGKPCLRYDTFAYLFGFVFFIFLLQYFISNKSKAFKYIAILLLVFQSIIVIRVCISHNIKNTISRIVNYYPEKVRVIDSYAKEHNLKFGVADYWDAKYTTMLSHEDLRVYTTINDKLNLWYHVTNENWYHDYNKGKYQKPVFNFVILEKKNPQKIKEYFGEPLDSLMYKGKSLVYIINDFKYDRKTRQPYLVGEHPGIR